MRGRVAWIHVAPIKSLRIQARDSVMVGPTGVEEDRRFCIVDEEGHRLNAKRVAAFVSVRPEFDDDMRKLTLHMPDGRRVSGPIELGAPVTVTTRVPDGGRADLDTLAALARYRGDLKSTEPLPFGVWARVVEPGRVAVGDEIVI